MIHLSVKAADAKHIRITGIDSFLAECLLRLEETLARRDSPEPSPRLFPSPTKNDDAINADWDNVVRPDLRHLFHSAGETVVRDLTGMEEDKKHRDCFRVTFATEHLSAWMSAINQARLLLGEQFDVTEDDMNQKQFDPGNLRDHALVKIHVLGYLLQLFVELQAA